ncbi:FAD dependent oxidoreductase [Lentithecium fluviatile CBS 122367]|uniref:L-2-hydroxyglutarate dehydrogenase, mitochondrial n=1 Tax=Lentithecium fluviatile CBS 122367 TaxID=1168545 RepID=A0A6G1J0G5_9PLEO|nr:FAD dependent oxidoreductase [Lentithecium fluviatile CBS 122367]
MFPSRALSKPITQTSRAFSSTARRRADFTHAVIGAGVVGLAVARKLQARDGVSTVLIEKHGSVGTETSSRNSEVIHAGLYYGADSLKTKLCLRGKEMMYELCKTHDIPHRNLGKWIVAQDGQQMDALQKVHDFASTIGVPIHFITKAEAARREPDVCAEAGILESPSTGIVDSHSLMQYLEGDFEDKGGVCAFKSPVSGITPVNGGAGGWEITTTTDGEETTITAETLVNSGGLAAIPISNMILPTERQRQAFYAKGSYFSYSLSQPKPNTLVYPAPVPGHGGLGTHLTLDMAGRVRFGPDVEWTNDPNDYTPNGKNLEVALDDIRSYLPGIDRSAIGLDYVGIRPKLGKLGAVASGKGFQDFYIVREEGFEGFVNLLGIESPGLTSALAIAEEVEGLLYR